MILEDLRGFQKYRNPNLMV